NSQRQRFQALHDAIASADTVLQSVESYLVSFQTDLGHVSAEIETLQSRSTTLNSQLENRRNLERLLGPAVQNIIVSPASVHAITNGPVDGVFVKALAELEDRARYIAEVGKKGADAGASAAGESNEGRNAIKAIEDVKPLIEELRLKAVERIRDYLVAQIKTLRSPNVNAQLLQQNALIRHKEIFAFLHRNHAQLAADLTQAYVNTMRWYFSSLFQRYIQAMEGIKLFPFDRNDLIGVDPAAAQKSVFQTPRLTTHDPFTLGRRIDILRTHNNMAISSQLAESDKTQHGIEVPFRNLTLALIDNISAEYAFLSDFFAPSLTFHQISRRATEMFEPVLTSGKVLVKTLIEKSMDCLGILLCVRLNQHFAFELQRRRCPVADGWINGVNMMLWPRFQIVMDMHCDSLRKATAGVATSNSRGASLASSLLPSGGGGGSGHAGGSADVMAASTAPHLFTQRFGQFLQGVLMLSSEAGDDEPVSVSLVRLRGEFDALVGKLSKACAGGDGKRRERFLVINYSLVLTIISVIGAGVVGLAVARQLASREGTSVVLLERNAQVGMETSSRNSESTESGSGQVIHAGIYYPESSLKTKLCIQGRKMLYDLCKKQKIPFQKIHKWVLAQDEEQLLTVQKLHEKAQRLGIPTRWVSRSEAERLEPSVRAQAGILESPETGILDSHSLMAYLHADFEDNGGTTALMSPVTNIQVVGQGQGGGYRIFTDEKGEDADSAIVVESVVNSAGLFACDISNMVLPPERHRKPFFAKGNYFSYASSDPRPKRLLYPTPKPGAGGLGTHLTLDLTGRIRFGPDVEWIDDPHDYAPNPARLKEAIQEIKTYLPNLREDAIDLDYAGIRPKLNSVGAAMGGTGFQDFIVQEEEGRVVGVDPDPEDHALKWRMNILLEAPWDVERANDDGLIVGQGVQQPLACMV
ncbi:hypothetical protein KEM56_000734, partial [Ascosphaera pollenicola]